VSNELEYAYGVAVDPAARHVAVAVRGYGPADQDGGFVGTNGSVMVFDAAGGGLVARLDGDSTNDFIGVAWDNVGNLYATDLTASVWRAYSPPGANQATTPAVPVIQVYEALAPPVLVNPIMGAGQIGFTLDGQSNVTYTIEFSADLSNPANWGSVTNSYDIVNDRSITVPVSGNAGFYRAVIR